MVTDFTSTIALALAILLFVPISTAAPLTRPSKYQTNKASAQCCAAGKACSIWLASASAGCHPGRWMSAQSLPCRQSACHFCATAGPYWRRTVCEGPEVRKNCQAIKIQLRSPSPTPSPSPVPSPMAAKCVYNIEYRRALIPAGALSAPSHWHRHSDGSITWRFNGGAGIDQPGSGTTCARFTVSRAGQYYLTLLSSAPHPTDHNDAWVRLSAGFDLYRPTGEKWKVGGRGWYKGFQNEGGRKLADYILTIDYDGHQFISKPLDTRRRYEVCLSGRSSRFRLYGIALARCTGGRDCNREGATIRRVMDNLKPAPCNM